MTKIYCVKCRNSQDVDATPGTITWTSGRTGKQCVRHCMNAICPHCGKKIHRFVSSPVVAAANNVTEKVATS